MKQYITGAVRISAAVAGMMMAWQAGGAAEQPKELNGDPGGQNATQQIGDNQCVKQFLDKELNVDTKLRNSSDYSGVIQGLLGGKVDVVLSMSPSSYASVYINNPKAVDIVGIAVDDKDQSRGYHSVVIVKADSPYKSLDDLKGKAFGFADPDSTSGYLIPNHAFKQKFGGTSDNKYNNFFSSVTFSGGHEQDILGVLNGQFAGAVTDFDGRRLQAAAIASVPSTALIRMDHPDLDEADPHHLAIAADPQRANPVSNTLPADFKAKVISAIKAGYRRPCLLWKAVGGTQHIGPGSVADFQQIIDMKRELVSAR